MIPLRLTLKNFLSYREATLDFRGLHTACICGANGSGKSSLLEGISWALWGESRAATEEDVIHLSEKEAQVDYWFQLRQQTYRILRTRVRGQATSLEFQVLTETGLKSLTGRGVRATQDLILQSLKLDYDTFINSAYLRQGKADEFMLKRPSERKQILTDLLKLDHYDQLSEQAKDQAKTLKAKIDVLEHSLNAIAEQLQHRDAIATAQIQIEAQISQVRQVQADLHSQRQTWQTLQQQRQTWQQDYQWQQQQLQATQQSHQDLQNDLQHVQGQHETIQGILNQTPAIQEGYVTWQRLQQEDEELAQRFERFQTLQAQHQQALQQQAQQVNILRDQHRQITLQLNADEQLEQELLPLIAKASEIEAAIAKLHQAKAQLTTLDQIQSQVSPLQQRRIELQTQIDRAQAKVMARIDELTTRLRSLQTQIAQHAPLEQTEREISQQIEALDKRQVYHQRVREKGQERRAFMEQLQTRIQDYEKQLQVLETKLKTHPTSGSACPLCDTPLDEHHWQRVQANHRQEQQDVRDQIWVLKEQLAVSEREITVLRQEYQEVGQELTIYGSLLERRGQIQAQIQAIAQSQVQVAQLETELAALNADLAAGAYAIALQQEKTELDTQLQVLNYDERNHALARG
jgi:DNA repair protein SbcC/Rad50